MPSFGTEVFDIAARGFGIGAGISRISLACGAFVVVNAGNATCADVLTLMKDVRSRVYQSFGVWLEPEVKLLGESWDVIFQ